MPSDYFGIINQKSIFIELKEIHKDDFYVKKSFTKYQFNTLSEFSQDKIIVKVIFYIAILDEVIILNFKDLPTTRIISIKELVAIGNPIAINGNLSLNIDTNFLIN